MILIKTTPTIQNIMCFQISWFFFSLFNCHIDLMSSLPVILSWRAAEWEKRFATTTASKANHDLSLSRTDWQMDSGTRSLWPSVRPTFCFMSIVTGRITSSCESLWTFSLTVFNITPQYARQLKEGCILYRIFAANGVESKNDIIASSIRQWGPFSKGSLSQSWSINMLLSCDGPSQVLRARKESLGLPECSFWTDAVRLGNIFGEDAMLYHCVRKCLMMHSGVGFLHWFFPDVFSHSADDLLINSQWFCLDRLYGRLNGGINKIIWGRDQYVFQWGTFICGWALYMYVLIISV